MTTLATLMLMTTVAVQGIDPAALPLTGAHAADFVPAGWTLEQQTRGSLTDAASTDLALVLKQGARSERVLLILTRGGDRGWRRAAVASKLLACSGCASPPTIRIADRVLSVSYGLLTFRFRREPASQEFLLIGQELTNPGPAGAGRVSTDYVAGTQQIEVRGVDAKTLKPGTVARHTRTVDKRRARMEDVDWNGDVDAWAQAAQQAIEDPDPQSPRVLVPTPGRSLMVGVPRALLARFRKDLGDRVEGTLGDLATQIVARRVELADPKAAPSERVLPPDAEFYWMTGPSSNCGTLGCTHDLYWASIATGESRALIAESADVETMNADLDVLERSAKGLFDIDVFGTRLTFDGTSYVVDKR